MADAQVTLLTRIIGRQSFGVPSFTGGGVTITPPPFACTSYMQHPSGQGDITWKGSLYGLSNPAAGAQVQRLAVTVTHRVSDPAAFSSATVTILAGASVIGSGALSLSLTPVQDTFTITTGYPAGQLSSLAVQVNHHAVAPGLAYITSVYAQASYSFPNAITGFTIGPDAVMPATVPSVGYPQAYLVAQGPASFSLAPQFARATAAGNLLIAWVSANSSSATFDTSCSTAGWLLAAQSGQAFGWFSLWYKPGCGRAEPAPVFTTTIGQASQPLSGLMEFTGARFFDQAGAAHGTTSLTLAPPSADTASGDLVVAAASWGTSSPGPAVITLTGADSAGKTLPLQLAGNETSTGTQFWATGWAQAGPGFGPSADTITATIGMFGGGGGAVASFKAVPGATPLPFAVPAMVNRAVTIPVRIG